VHQAVTQVARTSQDNLRLRISNVFGAQSKSCNMSMRVNQTWHECLTGDVDNRSVCRVDRLRGYRVNVFIFHKNIEGSLQARETIEHEVGILKENTRHPLPLPVSIQPNEYRCIFAQRGANDTLTVAVSSAPSNEVLKCADSPGPSRAVGGSMILNWISFSFGSRSATRNRGTSRAVLPVLVISPSMIKPSAVRAGMTSPSSSPGPDGVTGSPAQA